MWKYYEIYCVSITIYKQGSYKYLKEKKKVQTGRLKKKKKKKFCSYSATWTDQGGTVATVQNLEKKKGHNKPKVTL